MAKYTNLYTSRNAYIFVFVYVFAFGIVIQVWTTDHRHVSRSALVHCFDLILRKRKFFFLYTYSYRVNELYCLSVGWEPSPSRQSAKQTQHRLKQANWTNELRGYTVDMMLINSPLLNHTISRHVCLSVRLSVCLSFPFPIQINQVNSVLDYMIPCKQIGEGTTYFNTIKERSSSASSDCFRLTNSFP